MDRTEIARRIAALPPEAQEAALDAAELLYSRYTVDTPWGAHRPKAPDIVQCMYDRLLFGSLPDLREVNTWKKWFAFLNVLYGRPLNRVQLATFKQCTGRTEYRPPKGGYKEAVVIVGVQSGKSRIASLICVYEGLIAPKTDDGTKTYSLVLAQDFRNATRTMFSYARAPFETSSLLARRMLRPPLQNTVELDNDVIIAAYPCRPASIRGLRCRCVVLDEFAHYIGSEATATDLEMLRAARGRVATTGGRVVTISSPYGEFGELYELERAHFGRDDSPILIWRATAPMMNPTLDKDYIERMRETDPEGYRSEVLGEFRKGLATLLDPQNLAACVDPQVLERAPSSEYSYFAFVDMSGGRVDQASLAIGHRHEIRGDLEESRDPWFEGRKYPVGSCIAVVDLQRAWSTPHNPSGVAAEMCEILRRYGISQVTADRYAGEWPAEVFRENGVDYLQCEIPKSDLYLATLGYVNSRTARLLDNEPTLREYRALIRMRGPSGRDKVDHRPGMHDDEANSASGVLWLIHGQIPLSLGMGPWGETRDPKDIPQFGTDVKDLPSPGYDDQDDEDSDDQPRRRIRPSKFGYDV